MDANSAETYGAVAGKKRSMLNSIWQCRYFYIMLAPVVAWYLIFCYMPMYGVTLAFKTYNYNLGILGSPWIGIQNFKDILNDFQFWIAFKNTVIISLGKLIFHFPTPIILAILINELTRTKMKKFYQTVFTFPHFISWVVLSGILTNILGQTGVFNQIAVLLGGEASSPLVQASTFRPVLYITHIWKEIGWDSIIYLAALAGINPELYEAAAIDGANRFQKIMHVAWPGIRGTVAILLILTVGQIMSGGGAMTGSSFDQVFNLYSAPVYDVADTVDTFVYRTAFTVGTDFGYMTAVGFVKSAINLILLYTANFAVRKFGEQGLF